MCKVCVPECMYMYHVYVPAGAGGRGLQGSWSYRQLRAAIWVLGTKLAFSQELLNAELSPQSPKLGGFVFTVDGGGFFVSIFQSLLLLLLGFLVCS